MHPRTKKTTLFALTALLLIGLVPEAIRAQDGDAEEVEANDELRFVPETIEVEVGTTVRWTNVGELPHTVTSTDSNEAGERAPNDRFDEDLPAGEEATFTFDEEGTFEYYCKIHDAQDMIGTVTVVSQEGDVGETPGDGMDGMDGMGNGPDDEQGDTPGPGVMLVLAALVLWVAHRHR